MPTDLEQQLPHFAAALDREAPALSIDEIVRRGTVDVELEDSDRPTRNPISRWSTSGRSPTEDLLDAGDLDGVIELASPATESTARRLPERRIVLVAAAAVALVVALGVIVRSSDESDPVVVPPSTVSTPSTLPAPTPPTTKPPTSGGMWPQSTVEEVRAAQQRADAGDADVAWQLGTNLSQDDPWGNLDEFELVDRFVHEVLGWDAFVPNSSESEDEPDGWVDGAWIGQRLLRCAPGRTNPLYPPRAASEQPAASSCAPTVDDLTYESVSLDLAQLDRKGRDGIWVVRRWFNTVPFTQADPAVVEAEATNDLEAFLAARVAGTGAEGRVAQFGDVLDVPLLYATTSGAPYERYEIELVEGPGWPNGWMTFSTRLLTEGDAQVVEQQLGWYPEGGLTLDAHSTTEDGHPIIFSHASSDGELTLSAPSTWVTWLPGSGAYPVYEGDVDDEGDVDEGDVDDEGIDVWSGIVSRAGDYLGQGERIEIVDPVAYDAWCAANGGAPLLTEAADAATIAAQVVADPDFETTPPQAAQIAGLEAVSIDVALAPDGEACGIGITDISRWIHTIGWEPGWRLRLFLVDLPDGMSVDTLAVTVVAREERFDDVIAETAPILDSIELHPG